MNINPLPSRARVHSAPPASVPPRLLASWRRSENYGVPLDGVQPVFTGTADDGSLFTECGRDVLSDLRTTLDGEPVSLMLTDAEGVVLERQSGDKDLIKALDHVNLAPGFSYSEREAGTNGLGLALADRMPSLVRADDHYSLSLQGYTCAAAPIFDPATGRLEGAINLTTWSDARSGLLLALAQTAASATANLMLARSQGQRPRPAARGQVFRIEALRRSPGDEGAPPLSPAWEDALAQALAAMRPGRIVAAVGERGSGRATLLAQAERHADPRGHLLAVRAPVPDEALSWLSLWTPELRHARTGFVICDTDDLPAAAAERLAASLSTARDTVAGTYGVTAESFDTLPAALVPLIDAIVQVPPLRERTGDILPLADHLARRFRGRPVRLTPGAARALTDYAWPGNVAELATVIRDAASRTDEIDVRHLPSTLLARAEHLPPIRAFERDEMVRVLTRPGMTVEQAGRELGMSRATVYRKLALYSIRLS